MHILQEKIKIGFTGTQGTGKTTACYELSTELKKQGYDVNIITEAARSCPLPINENTTVKSQLWIFGETIKREMGSNAQITVCDRTLLDIIVYMMRIEDRFSGSLRWFINLYMQTYDVMFYMDTKEGFLVDDGVRSINKEFQDEIKKMIDKEIEILEIPVSYVKTTDERLKIVDSVVKYRSLK